MSGPSNFVSFADYLGLNDEAGQQMLDKSSVDANKQLADAEAMNEKHFNAARGAGEGKDGGVYAQTGDAARRGLASYGDFMRGMADPAARQALMEKTYGKGAVSALDSALVGAAGGGQIAAGQKKFQATQARFESRDMDADARKDRYAQQTAAQGAEDARGLQARQDAEDAREKNRLAKKYWMENHSSRGSFGPMSDRDNELRMNTIVRESGALNKDGSTDWDKLDRNWQRSRQTMYENRPKTFWGGEIDLFGPKPQDPSQDTNTWANYYAKNKRTGAK